MYKIYPGHGVVKIGKGCVWYGSVAILCKDLSILKDLPTPFEFESHEVEPNGQYKGTWNKRYREYIELLKSADWKSWAQAEVDLTYLRVIRELSFGERKMLQQATQMLSDLRSAIYDKAS